MLPYSGWEHDATGWVAYNNIHALPGAWRSVVRVPAWSSEGRFLHPHVAEAVKGLWGLFMRALISL